MQTPKTDTACAPPTSTNRALLYSGLTLSGVGCATLPLNAWLTLGTLLVAIALLTMSVTRRGAGPR